MLLVKKYMPKKIHEILGNNGIMEILEKMEQDLPHLLLSGPPGTGKTTVAHLLQRNRHTLELNASDERGIDTIRSKVKDFCYKKEKNKLVILDECDHLTSGAQQSLRRLMEETETQFILICNRVSEIIEPVQSRCAILQFSRIVDIEIKKRLNEICRIESICITDDGLNAVIEVCNGDMRQALNCLEAVRRVDDRIDCDFLFNVAGVTNYKRIEQIFESVKGGIVDECLERFELLWNEKHEASDLMDSFMRVGKQMENYEVLKVVGKYHIRVLEGCTSKIQFYGMFYELLKIFKN